MRNVKQLLLTSAMLAVLAGCNSDNDDQVIAPPKAATIKVVHAVSDAPAVNVDGGSSIAVRQLAFGSSSPQLTVNAGSYNLTVDALLPGAATARVINAPSVNLQADTNYTVFATGSAAGNSIAPLVVSSPIAAVAAGTARVQVVHAASAAPTVDIHVTAPDAALSGSTVAATLAFSKFTAPLALNAGNYRVRITPAGALTPVVFDSGTVNFAAGTDVMVAAINNRFAGKSPVSLLAVNANGSSADIRDANSTADVRVVHAVSDAPAVDILLNNNKAIANLAFPNATGYNNLTPGAYNVKVAASADNKVVVINADLTLTAGSYGTIIATGSLGQNNITPLVLADNPRRIATAAQLRLVHGSTLAGNVDIYVTKTRDISSATPNFSNVPFKADTGYVQLLPGEYVVTVTPAGSKNAAIGPLTLNLAGNKIYTAIARDNTGRTAPLGLILLDDFAG